MESAMAGKDDRAAAVWAARLPASSRRPGKSWFSGVR